MVTNLIEWFALLLTLFSVFTLTNLGPAYRIYGCLCGAIGSILWLVTVPTLPLRLVNFVMLGVQSLGAYRAWRADMDCDCQ